MSDQDKAALAQQAVPEGFALVQVDALTRWRDAFAEELAAYDIDPPIHHVKASHDEIAAMLAAAPAAHQGRPPIEYRYAGGTHWCELGPAERMKADFEGVYRLKAGGPFPTEQAAPQAEQQALGVPHEPHQSLQERTLLAAQQAEREPSKCAQCKKAYKPGVKTSGCPKCAPGLAVSEEEFCKPLQAEREPPSREQAIDIASQAPAVGAPANMERDYARALDAINGHVERIKVLEQQVRDLQAFKDGVELHQRGGSNSWYWLDDRENYLETMVASLPVVIRAEQLRALLSQPPVQGSQS